MALQTVWTVEKRIFTYETDFLGRWKPSSIFQNMQEAALAHAEHLGVGYEALRGRGLAWILVRVRLHLEKLPGVGCGVRLSTWPCGIDQKILFVRDFVIQTAEGQGVAAASTVWLLVDTQTRRLVQPDRLGVELPENDGRRALTETPPKLALPPDLPACFSAAARYSTLDVNGHVTNTVYVDWALDCFAPQEHHRRLEWLQINYISEVKPGGEVQMFAGGDGRVRYVRGVHAHSGAAAFEAALGWGDAG